MSNQALKSNIEKYETTVMYGQKQALVRFELKGSKDVKK
jgi:hypothetical protein